MGRQRLGQIGELVDGQYQRILEGAVLDLLQVARIEHHHALASIIMPLPQPTLHGGRIDGRRARVVQRLAIVTTEADDLVLDLGLQPRERLVLAEAGLDPHIGEARISTQFRVEAIDRGRRTRQEQVQPLARHQDRPLQAGRLGTRLQLVAQGPGGVDDGEMIGSGIGDHPAILAPPGPVDRFTGRSPLRSRGVDPADHGKLSEAGRCGQAGAQSAMDGALRGTQEQLLPSPACPHRPPTTERPLLLLPLPLRVPGATRPNPLPPQQHERQQHQCRRHRHAQQHQHHEHRAAAQ